MSGTIIKFPGIEIPGVELSGRKARLRQQVARIEALLDELEDIKEGAEAVPLSLIAEAQTAISSRLGRASDAVLHAPEPDPQPDVDRALLERLYGTLDPDPKR